MYVSKYYSSGEEIDERLKQGYYLDAQDKGYADTLDAFWTMILSITDKVDKKDGYDLSENDFTDEYKAKLDYLIENIITKVSQLENDMNYQTDEDVQKAIDDLIDGSDEALDTLKELADALNNDPNFATNIINAITQVKNDLQTEVDRATAAEADLSNQITESNANINSAIQELITRFDSALTSLQDQVHTLEDKVDADVASLADYKTEMATTIAEVKAEAKDYTDTETDRAKEAETNLQDQIRELTNTHTTDISSVNAAITNETTARQNADTTLQNNIDSEAATRESEDTAIREEFAAADEEIKNNYVPWTSVPTTEFPNRKSILLPTNGDVINGVDTTGATIPLIQLYQDIVKLGSSDKVLNIDSSSRPTVNTDNEIAYVDDVQKWFGIIEVPEAYQNNCWVTAITSLTQDYIDSNGNPENINGSAFDATSNTYTLGEPYLAVSYQDIALVTHYSLYSANNSNYIGAVFYAIVDLAKQNEANFEEVKQEIQDVVSDNTTDRSELEALIQAEAQARQEADEKLDEDKVDKVDGYGLSKNDFTDALLEKLNNIEEYANYITNVSQLVNDANYQTADQVAASISDLIGSAPEVLDTLEEIAAALGDDPNFASTMTKKLAALAEDINTETEARTAADTQLQTNIDNLSSTVDSKLSSLQTDLQNQINTEATTRQEADTQLQNNITNEATERQNADNNLQSQITQELSDRQSADQNLQTQITDLATQLGQAGSNLKEYVDELIANLQTQINSNSSLIATNTANIQRNLELIQGLQSQINSINDIVTSVNEIVNNEVNERKEADAQLQANIDQVAADLVTETAAREAADQVLQTNIDNLEADVDQEISDLESKHDQDIEAEETARQEADQAIQDQIDTFPDNIRINEEFSQTETQVQITHTYAYRDSDGKYTGTGTHTVTIPAATSSLAGVMTASDKANLDQVQTDLQTEITNRTAADTTLQNNLNTEISNRENADTALQDQITSLGTKVDEHIEEASNTYATLQLVVNLHASITFSANRTVIYKGESDTVTISHSATFDGDPLTYTLTVDGAALANPYTLEDSHTFTGVFSIDNEDPDVAMDITRTLTVNAYYPRYYGYLASSTITADDVTTLTKQSRASSAAISSLSVTFSTAGYLWLCVPSGMTVSSVTSSGFSVPMEDPVTVEVSGKGNYLCYRSIFETNAGTVTYTVS